MIRRILLATTATLLLGTGSSFADITLTADPPDYGASPAMFTLDPELYSPAQRGVAGTRQLRQTFQLSQTVDVNDIILSLAMSGTDGGMVLNFYQVADVNASSWTPGDLIKTLSLDTNVDLPTSTARLELTLTGSDVFTLAQRDTGTEGYGIEVSNNDGISTIGNFRHSNDGTEHYLLGRFYKETGSPSGTGRDLGVSLSGIVVPEPATAALIGFGALALVGLRRRVR